MFAVVSWWYARAHPVVRFLGFAGRGIGRGAIERQISLFHMSRSL